MPLDIEDIYKKYDREDDKDRQTVRAARSKRVRQPRGKVAKS